MQKLTLFFLFLLGSFIQVNAQPDRPVHADNLQIPPFKKKAERVPQYPLKTKRMIFTEDDLAIARLNIERYPKAKKVKETIVKAADQWLSWADEDLHDLLPSGRVPRDFDLNAKG